jgi:hypothetical protein
MKYEAALNARGWALWEFRGSTGSESCSAFPGESSVPWRRSLLPELARPSEPRRIFW